MKFAEEIPSSVTRAEGEALAELAEGNELVLEVGSQWGRSTILLASVAIKVVAVDWHGGDFYAGYKPTLGVYHYNLDRYGITNVITLVSKIEEADLTPYTFDGAFIDADHDELSAHRHYALVYPHVVPGGWIAFHDYGRFGVTAAVDSLGNPERVVESLAILRKEK